MTAVDKILNASNIEQQAAVLRAIANHPALAAACKLAGIDSLKEEATTKYVCDADVGTACSSENAHGKAMRDKHHAVKMVLTFTAPSPNRVPVAPCQRNRDPLIAIALLTRDPVNSTVIKRESSSPLE